MMVESPIAPTSFTILRKLAYSYKSFDKISLESELLLNVKDTIPAHEFVESQKNHHRWVLSNSVAPTHEINPLQYKSYSCCLDGSKVTPCIFYDHNYIMTYQPLHTLLVNIVTVMGWLH